MELAPNSRASRAGRRLLKRLMYSQLGMVEAFRILLGRAEPKAAFTVKADPASVYWNFLIREDQLPAFIDYIKLPEGFEICPIQCLAGEAPGYILTLNVYEVSGLAVGVRAEWSTYILDHMGKPRYMVLEALSSTASLDSVDIITRKSQVEHSTVRGAQTLVKDLEGGQFESRYADKAVTGHASLAPQWLEANDYIYWRSGICDRTFYDSGLANPEAVLVEPASVEIANHTHWERFLEPLPRHVIQFNNAIDFVISPWENL
jgi:hypothetical protein